MSKLFNALRIATHAAYMSGRIAFISVIVMKYPTERRRLKMQYLIARSVQIMTKYFPPPIVPPDESELQMQRNIEQLRKIIQN